MALITAFALLDKFMLLNPKVPAPLFFTVTLLNVTEHSVIVALFFAVTFSTVTNSELKFLTILWLFPVIFTTSSLVSA